MNPKIRDYFDRQLDAVMADMPARVHELLDEVPMYVEDFPAENVLRERGIHDRRRLCGLYTGIPLPDRSVMQSGVLSDVIYIYREGILATATTRSGQIDETELRRQIRITILHELGHHHGLDEDDLEELGYA